MGTPAFSAPILRMLVEEGYNVLAVVTQPDRPVGRKKVLTPPPVKEEALKLGLPIIQPDKTEGLRELEQIITLKPDLIVTAAFGQILPKELLDAPKLGCINVHASLITSISRWSADSSSNYRWTKKNRCNYYVYGRKTGCR